ncbi:hypothetical protein EDC01DRAFT_752555 [Geopyxis carbonaria]|nr:hypothetical protein EDC01DRAFT_752555 [Geopyxis carbonaria]
MLANTGAEMPPGMPTETQDGIKSAVSNSSSSSSSCSSLILRGPVNFVSRGFGGGFFPTPTESEGNTSTFEKIETVDEPQTLEEDVETVDTIQLHQEQAPGISQMLDKTVEPKTGDIVALPAQTGKKLAVDLDPQVNDIILETASIPCPGTDNEAPIDDSLNSANSSRDDTSTERVLDNEENDEKKIEKSHDKSTLDSSTDEKRSILKSRQRRARKIHRRNLVDTVNISRNRLRNFLTQLYQHAPEPYMTVVKKTLATPKGPRKMAKPRRSTQLSTESRNLKFDRFLNANGRTRASKAPRNGLQPNRSRRTTYPAADCPPISQFTGFNKQLFNQNSQSPGLGRITISVPSNSRALITREFAQQIQDADRKNKANIRILKKEDSTQSHSVEQFLIGASPKVSGEEGPQNILQQPQENSISEISEISTPKASAPSPRHTLQRYSSKRLSKTTSGPPGLGIFAPTTSKDSEMVSQTSKEGATISSRHGESGGTGGTNTRRSLLNPLASSFNPSSIRLGDYQALLYDLDNELPCQRESPKAYQHRFQNQEPHSWQIPHRFRITPQQHPNSSLPAPIGGFRFFGIDLEEDLGGFIIDEELSGHKDENESLIPKEANCIKENTSEDKDTIINNHVEMSISETPKQADAPVLTSTVTSSSSFSWADDAEEEEERLLAEVKAPKTQVEENKTLSTLNKEIEITQAISEAVSEYHRNAPTKILEPTHSLNDKVEEVANKLIMNTGPGAGLPVFRRGSNPASAPVHIGIDDVIWMHDSDDEESVARRQAVRAHDACVYAEFKKTHGNRKKNDRHLQNMQPKKVSSKSRGTVPMEVSGTSVSHNGKFVDSQDSLDVRSAMNEPATPNGLGSFSKPAEVPISTSNAKTINNNGTTVATHIKVNKSKRKKENLSKISRIENPSSLPAVVAIEKNETPGKSITKVDEATQNGLQVNRVNCLPTLKSKSNSKGTVNPSDKDIELKTPLPESQNKISLESKSQQVATDISDPNPNESEIWQPVLPKKKRKVKSEILATPVTPIAPVAHVTTVTPVTAREPHSATSTKLSMDNTWAQRLTKDKNEAAIKTSKPSPASSAKPLQHPLSLAKLKGESSHVTDKTYENWHRKLYISGIPHDATYETWMSNIRGGLIDDTYISGLSPDYAHYTGVRRGDTRNSNQSEVWFGYITFYKAEGAQNFIRYLRAIDPGKGEGVGKGLVVAHMMVQGQRLQIQLRDNDQRAVSPDIVSAVENHGATRVLLFTFKKDLGRLTKKNITRADIKPLRHDGSIKWDWNMWLKAFCSKENGHDGLERIEKQIQIWGGSPKVYIDNIRILPKDTITSKTPVKTSAPKSFLGPNPNEVIRVVVSFLRISSAEKVKSILETHRDYYDHCVISYHQDPCTNMEGIPPLPTPTPPSQISVSASNGPKSSHENVPSNVIVPRNNFSSGHKNHTNLTAPHVEESGVPKLTKAAKKRANKAAKKNAAPNFSHDSNLFPPLPTSTPTAAVKFKSPSNGPKLLIPVKKSENSLVDGQPKTVTAESPINGQENEKPKDIEGEVKPNDMPTNRSIDIISKECMKPTKEILEPLSQESSANDEKKGTSKCEHVGSSNAWKSKLPSTIVQKMEHQTNFPGGGQKATINGSKQNLPTNNNAPKKQNGTKLVSKPTQA